MQIIKIDSSRVTTQSVVAAKRQTKTIELPMNRLLILAINLIKFSPELSPLFYTFFEKFIQHRTTIVFLHCLAVNRRKLLKNN